VGNNKFTTTNKPNQWLSRLPAIFPIISEFPNLSGFFAFYRKSSNTFAHRRARYSNNPPTFKSLQLWRVEVACGVGILYHLQRFVYLLLLCKQHAQQWPSAPSTSKSAVSLELQVGEGRGTRSGLTLLFLWQPPLDSENWIKWGTWFDPTAVF